MGCPAGFMLARLHRTPRDCLYPCIQSGRKVFGDCRSVNSWSYIILKTLKYCRRRPRYKPLGYRIWQENQEDDWSHRVNLLACIQCRINDVSERRRRLDSAVLGCEKCRRSLRQDSGKRGGAKWHSFHTGGKWEYQGRRGEH